MKKEGRDFIKRLYAKAGRQKYAIGAFNFSTLEILHAIVRTGKRLKAPIIVSVSEGEEQLFGSGEAVAVVNFLKQELKGQVILHADHHKTFKTAKASADAGFKSVHIDGSAYPYEKNVRVTKKVVDYCHKRGIWVEGELGHVGGSSTLHKESISKAALPEYMTDPEQAAEFVRRTGVDSLAINIGNAHGVWKGRPKLNFERLRAIKRSTKKFLVLHGGSGIDTSSFRKAISLGINKININSDMRIAYGDALTKSMKEKKDYTPYHYMQPPIAAVEGVVEEKMRIFKCTGKL